MRHRSEGLALSVCPEMVRRSFETPETEATVHLLNYITETLSEIAVTQSGIFPNAQGYLHNAAHGGQQYASDRRSLIVQTHIIIQTVSPRPKGWHWRASPRNIIMIIIILQSFSLPIKKLLYLFLSTKSLGKQYRLIWRTLLAPNYTVRSVGYNCGHLWATVCVQTAASEQIKILLFFARLSSGLLSNCKRSNLVFWYILIALILSAWYAAFQAFQCECVSWWNHFIRCTDREAASKWPIKKRKMVKKLPAILRLKRLSLMTSLQVSCAERFCQAVLRRRLSSLSRRKTAFKLEGIIHKHHLFQHNTEKCFWIRKFDALITALAKNGQLRSCASSDMAPGSQWSIRWPAHIVLTIAFMVPWILCTPWVQPLKGDPCNTPCDTRSVAQRLSSALSKRLQKFQQQILRRWRPVIRWR